jgi:hypothetical protein
MRRAQRDVSTRIGASSIVILWSRVGRDVSFLYRCPALAATSRARASCHRRLPRRGILSARASCRRQPCGLSVAQTGEDRVLPCRHRRLLLLALSCIHLRWLPNYESGGREFESLRARQLRTKPRTFVVCACRPATTAARTALSPIIRILSSSTSTCEMTDLR